MNVSEKLSINTTLRAYTSMGERKTARILAGSFASTQHFPNNNVDKLRMQALQVDGTDMEIVAFMKTCWLYQKSCIAFKGVSNIIAPFTKETPYTTWNQANQRLAEDNAGAVTVNFIENF